MSSNHAKTDTDLMFEAFEAFWQSEAGWAQLWDLSHDKDAKATDWKRVAERFFWAGIEARDGSRPAPICACCAEGKHVSLCHNVRWATARLECGCGCAPPAARYRALGYSRQDCGHGSFYPAEAVQS